MDIAIDVAALSGFIFVQNTKYFGSEPMLPITTDYRIFQKLLIPQNYEDYRIFSEFTILIGLLMALIVAKWHVNL